MVEPGQVLARDEGRPEFLRPKLRGNTTPPQRTFKCSQWSPEGRGSLGGGAFTGRVLWADPLSPKCVNVVHCVLFSVEKPCRNVGHRKASRGKTREIQAGVRSQHPREGGHSNKITVLGRDLEPCQERKSMS